MLTTLKESHLSQLKNCKDAGLLSKMLESFSRHPLKDTAVIKSYHDLLLFYCAFPFNGHIYKLAINELERINHELQKIAAGHNSRKHLSLMGSGLRNTDLLCHYSYTLTRWLIKKFPGKVMLDSSEAKPDAVRNILYLFMPAVRYQQVTQGDLSLINRIKLLSGETDHSAQLKWLIRLFERSELPLDVKEEFYQQLKVFVRWKLDDEFFNRSFLHCPVDHLYYPHEFIKLPAASRVIRHALEAPLELDSKHRKRFTDIMKATLAFQYKETDPITYANENELEVFDLGRGLRVALVGMVRDKKLSIENYIGYMAFRNGVPVGYGGGWLFGQRCKIGLNVFPPFRNGESAWLFLQVLRVYFQRHGARHFIIKPFQFGKGNMEGLKSGAFWFYYKLGFRPVDKEIRRIAAEEWKMKLALPTHRTMLTKLRKIASCNMEWKTQRGVWPDYDAAEVSERFIGEPA